MKRVNNSLVTTEPYDESRRKHREWIKKMSKKELTDTCAGVAKKHVIGFKKKNNYLKPSSRKLLCKR